MEEIVIEPSVNLLESMRSVGYSMEAALADVVDNSIDADATTIEIDFDVVSGSFIAILDNGFGMLKDAAIEALRLAGTANSHESKHLGRFGLGLKTASLSQARSLTVLSKKNSKVIALRWDIDRVKESKTWNLQLLDEAEYQELPLFETFENITSGTLVIWSKLDLLLGDSFEPGRFLAEKIAPVSEHLGLTFHRFIDRTKNKISISVNGNKIVAIDPFLSANPKTQQSPLEVIEIGDQKVSFKAFTLPHASGLSAKERARSDLGDGMREAQGFYIYRNQRLISRGHWFGLARMTELTKQTRVLVDIPRELDSLWQLDIKKSRTEPPASFKAHLKKLIDPLLAKGKRLHTFRGRKDGSTETVHIWDKIRERDGFRYEINLENPVVKATLSSLTTAQAEEVSSLFSTIAEQFPHLDAYQEMAGNLTPIRDNPTNEDISLKLISLYGSGALGLDENKVFQLLKNSEPFNQVENLFSLIQEVWGHNDGTK